MRAFVLSDPSGKVSKNGSVAQLVEQRIENPRVGGSIPPRATKLKKPTRNGGLFLLDLIFTVAFSALNDSSAWFLIVIEHT
jgi:hypothetical protein